MKKLRGYSTDTLLLVQEIMNQEDYENLIFQSKKIIVHYCIKRKIETFLDVEEINDVVMEALRYFNKSYDNRKGVKASTFYYKTLIGVFQTTNNKKSKRFDNEYTNNINDCYNPDIFYEKPTLDTYNLTDLEQEVLKLDLPQDTKDIIILVSRGNTFENIANQYGVTKQAINKRLKRLSNNIILKGLLI